MAITVCLNTTTLQYSSSILEKYCHQTNVVCASYGINYESNTIKIKSNLAPAQRNTVSLNADMCLEGSNLAFTPPSLEESLQEIKQVMQYANTNYDICVMRCFAKAVMALNPWSILTFPQWMSGESFIETVEKECSYGDGRVFCMGADTYDCLNTIIASRILRPD